MEAKSPKPKNQYTSGELQYSCQNNCETIKTRKWIVDNQRGKCIRRDRNLSFWEDETTTKKSRKREVFTEDQKESQQKTYSVSFPT